MLLITGHLSPPPNHMHQWRSQKFSKGTFQDTVDFKNTNWNHLMSPYGSGMRKGSAGRRTCQVKHQLFSGVTHAGQECQRKREARELGQTTSSGAGNLNRFHRCMTTISSYKAQKVYERLGSGLPWIPRKTLKVSQMIVVMWL